MLQLTLFTSNKYATTAIYNPTHAFRWRFTPAGSTALVSIVLNHSLLVIFGASSTTTSHFGDRLLTFFLVGRFLINSLSSTWKSSSPFTLYRMLYVPSVLRAVIKATNRLMVIISSCTANRCSGPFYVQGKQSREQHAIIIAMILTLLPLCVVFVFTSTKFGLCLVSSSCSCSSKNYILLISFSFTNLHTSFSL